MDELCLLLFWPVVAVATVLWLAASSAEKSEQDALLREIGAEQPPWPPHFDPAHYLAVIRDTDPTFSWEAFCARALAAYEVVQRSRMTRCPDLAVRFVTPALREGLSEVVEAAMSRDLPTILQPVCVTGIGPVGLEAVGDAHYFRVRIVGLASQDCAQAIVNSKNPLVLAVPQPDGTALIDEVWTFVRPIGARTALPTALTRCPICGGPIVDPNETACHFCGEALRQGESDWMVNEIRPARPSRHALFGRDGAVKPVGAATAGSATAADVRLPSPAASQTGGKVQ